MNSRFQEAAKELGRNSEEIDVSREMVSNGLAESGDGDGGDKKRGTGSTTKKDTAASV